MLSSIKEFLIDTIFSGRKRKRSQTTINKIDNNSSKFSQVKYYKYKCSNYKNYVDEDIVDLIENNEIQEISQDIKRISLDEIFKIKIQISSTELSFFEKLNSFTKMKDDRYNYPDIESSNFIKLISLLHYNILNSDASGTSPDIKISEFLNLDSLKKLAGNLAIDDDIINTYIDLIQKRQTNNLTNIQKNFSTFFIFKTYFFSIIKNKQNLTNRRLNYLECFSEENKNFRKFMKYLDKKKIDLFSYTRILIPILIKNKTGSFSYSLKLGLDQNQFEYNTNLYYNQFKPDEDSYHWALISANLKTGKMILYDSKCSFSEEGKNSMQILSKFFDFYIEEKCKNSFLIPNKHGKEAKKLFQQEDDSEMRFESEGSSDEEDIPENSTQITSNQTFNLEDDIYSNCKRVLNFDEGNDISVDKDREFDKSYSRWKFKYANNPKQSATNETDSGVFVCKFLEYITRDEPILFDKHDLEYFRILMSVELIESKLITG